MRSLRATLVPLAVFALLAPAHAGPRGMLCSDLTIPPPAEGHKVKNKVIYQEIVEGVFPAALFPLSYADHHEVSPDDLYYDDRGRVMSGKAAVAILENHPASQDQILAWRSNTEAESQARLELAGGVAGAAVGGTASAAAYADQAGSAWQNLERLDGGAESAFGQAVCVYNAAMAERRARTHP